MTKKTANVARDLYLFVDKFKTMLVIHIDKDEDGTDVKFCTFNDTIIKHFPPGKEKNATSYIIKFKKEYYGES